MPDINENDYQYAEDLPVEDHTTLDGSEKFVMFDETSGKQASLSEVAAYMDDHLDAGNKINTVKVDGTALVPDANKAVNIDLSEKVDKVPGKGLSTNDYTNTDKNKLGDIEDEANKTVVDAELDGESSNPVENQAVTAELERLDERKAEIDGYYDEMSVGTAEQLISSKTIEDTELYTFRTSGGSADIGNRLTDSLVGGTVVWNQLIKNGNFADGKTSWTHAQNTTVTVSNGVATITQTAQYNGLLQTMNDNPFVTGHKYLLIADMKADSERPIHLLFGDNYYFTKYKSFTLTTNWTHCCYMDTITSNVASGRQIFGVRDSATSGFVTYYVKNAMFIDLTAVFGPTIADYIYSLEQANTGAGVAWFRKYFPKSYYAYDAGSLQSVNVATHDMVGFNTWDEEWENGVYSVTQGTPASNNAFIRNKNAIRVVGGASYYINHSTTEAAVLYYDADMNYLSYNNASTNKLFTTPIDATYINFYAKDTTYKNDICINLSWSGYRNGEYEPYEKHSYPYDGTVQLRGIPYLTEDGSLQYNGDTYTSDGTVTRKYGVVDLGSLSWSYISGGNNSRFVGRGINVKIGSLLMVSGKLTPTTVYGDVFAHDVDNSIVAHPTASQLEAYASAYTDSTSFKTAMSGVYLVYELATPTAETADPYTNPQIVNDFGTEEYVDAGVKAGTRDVVIPVGHITQYMANLRDKLQHLPGLAEDDGDYIVRQTDKEMSLKPLAPYFQTEYSDLVAGSAKQLLSSTYEEDKAPYTFRKSGGSISVGDREYVDAIVGGTVAWNQLADGGTFTKSFAESSSYYGTLGNLDKNVSIIANHVYFLRAKVTRSISGNNALGTLIGAANSGIYVDIGNGESNGTVENIVKASSSFTSNATSYSNYSGNRGFSAGDSIEVKNIGLTDLTAMFGSTIADYIYSLETATAGSGIAKLREWGFFRDSYYSYDPDSLQSVCVGAHECAEFNAWDEEWELAVIDWNTLIFTPSATGGRFCPKNYIKVIPNENYYVNMPSTASAAIIGYTDENGNGGRYLTATNNIITIPSDVTCMKFGITTASYSTTYNHDICINISNPSRNGEYQPYEKHTYPLDSTKTLRGLFKLDSNNNLYCDGDIYLPSAEVERKWATVTFDGTENWQASINANRFYVDYRDDDFFDYKYSSDVNAQCFGDYTYYGATSASTYMSDKQFAFWYASTQPTNNLREIIVYDSDCSTVAEWKAKLQANPLRIVYEKTPTTETADPYTAVQICDPDGTEEFVDALVEAGTRDVAIPAGHVTRYTPDLRAKLEKSPDNPSNNGDYILRKSASGVSYVPLTLPSELPEAPSANGTYTLKVTISNGTPTYSWVTE